MAHQMGESDSIMPRPLIFNTPDQKSTISLSLPPSMHASIQKAFAENGAKRMRSGTELDKCGTRARAEDPSPLAGYLILTVKADNRASVRPRGGGGGCHQFMGTATAGIYIPLATWRHKGDPTQCNPPRHNAGNGTEGAVGCTDLGSQVCPPQVYFLLAC